MDTTKKKIAVDARVRIVATVKGHELSRAENYSTIIEIDRWLIHQPAAQNAMVDTLTRQAFVKTFLERIRHDAVLRRHIGGTRWSVDLIHYNYRDAI